MRNMSVTPTTMTSPKNHTSPKEKRSFSFFRTRTLSTSSNEASSGPSSPRLSPRTLFDKVKNKITQSDSKSSNTSGDNSNNTNGKKNSGPPIAPSAAKSTHKRLSHSISEEKDDYNNNSTDTLKKGSRGEKTYTDINYQTYHGTTKGLNSNARDLISNLNSLQLGDKLLSNKSKVAIAKINICYLRVSLAAEALEKNKIKRQKNRGSVFRNNAKKIDKITL